MLNAWSLQIGGEGGAPPDNPPPDDPPGDPPPDDPPGDPPPGQNHAPVAGDDHYSIVVNQVLSLKFSDLLRNDVDPDGDRLFISFFGNDVHGSVEFDSATTSILFTPDFGYAGQGGFQYIVHDGDLTAVGTVTIDIEASFQGHNSLNGLDVNDDGQVSPIDALLIINYLNAPKEAAPDSGVMAVNAYYDVVADNVIAPLDALTVINYLNSVHLSGLTSTAAGEGQSQAAAGALLAEEDSTADSGDATAAQSAACRESEAAATATASRRRLRAAVDYLMATDAVQKLLDELDLPCGKSS
jgi:hypothetical protein